MNSVATLCERGAFTCPLSDPLDERDAGGKAANLSRIVGDGVPVPEGVVLTRAAFDLFLLTADLRSRLGQLCAPLSQNDGHDAFQMIADAARGLIFEALLPVEIEDALEAIAGFLLPSGPVIVRSSAVEEDGRTASLAGQFDSITGVVSLDELRLALRACYASYWSARVLFYRQRRGVTAGGMAVIVQRQIAPVAAGVLFTRDPSGTDDRMVIEFTDGLADRLVSGLIDPHRLVVSRSSAAIISESVAPGPEQSGARSMVAARVEKLAGLALGLEKRLGAPQDVEWAIDQAGRTWIVQSRAITATASPLQSRTVLWSNANICENFPQPISPLLYSIASLGYYHYFRNLGLAFGVSRRRLASMDRALRSIIGVHGARMYYNLTSIHSVLRMAPLGDRLGAAFNMFVGATETAEQPDGAVAFSSASVPGKADARHKRGRVSRSLELVRIALYTCWQYAFFKRRIVRFERTADTFGRLTGREPLATASLDQLGAHLAAFVDIRCHRWKDASLADAAAMVTYALLGRVLAASGFSGVTETRLLRALPDVPSSIPPRRLWALSRMILRNQELLHLFERAGAEEILHRVRREPKHAPFRASLDEYLQEWGFRSSGELMLTEPSLDERPEPVIDLLQQYIRDTGESPEVAIQRQAVERRRETSLVLRTLARRSPLRAAVVWLLVRGTQRSIAYRERARFKQALLYTRCRRLALTIGDALVARGLLDSRDDVFLFTVSELDEATAGRAMLPAGMRSIAAVRRQHHEAQSRLSPPDTFRLPDGEVFDSAWMVAESTVGSSVAMSGEVLSGTTACGGRVSSTASVLADVSESARLRRGDILVTRQTDPGWAPVFCLVSGLIIERGGMLSHGAIIAREFGLPCIVGVPRATERIAHGARVTLDADRGQCTVEAIA